MVVVVAVVVQALRLWKVLHGPQLKSLNNLARALFFFNMQCHGMFSALVRRRNELMAGDCRKKPIDAYETKFRDH